VFVHPGGKKVDKAAIIVQAAILVLQGNLSNV
jgi:hypothetical protein